MQKEMNAKQDNSAVAKLVARIIDNFQLRISHVHIRFEDHSYSLECFLKSRSCPGHAFAAGIILEKLRLYSPSEDNEDTGFLIPGVIKKKVKLHRFGIYWDFDQGACVATNSASLLQECMVVPFQHPGEVSMVHTELIPCHFILEPISLQLHATIDTRSVELRCRRSHHRSDNRIWMV